MKVHLHHIPEGDTLHIEGEEDAAPLELEQGGFTPTAPLCYSLDVGLSGGGLFATGSLSVRGKMQCVNCLEDFDWELVIDPFSMQIDLPKAELIDLTPEVREDMHLALPAHPKCDSGGEKQCPARRDDSRVAFGRPVEKSVPAWDALDKLKPKLK
jgi:uncharacterized metal-binding protein YceD (DUF177 family)